MKPPRSPTDVALDRHLSPVNKMAAIVTARGVHWTPDKKIQERDSMNPIPCVPPNPASPVKIGRRFGSLTVIGAALDQPKKGKSGTLYVCRCSCGYYTERRTKAVMNPANDKDACGRCLQLQFLKRRDAYNHANRHSNYRYADDPQSNPSG